MFSLFVSIVSNCDFCCPQCCRQYSIYVADSGAQDVMMFALGRVVGKLAYANEVFHICLAYTYEHAWILFDCSKPVESKTRTYHGWVGSGRTAGRRGGAGQDRTPTEQFAKETSDSRTLHGIEETSLERLLRSTNKQNSM